MVKETFVHGEYIVSVDAKQNEHGCMVFGVHPVKDGTAVPVHLSEATRREWTTEAVAIWSGIDQDALCEFAQPERQRLTGTSTAGTYVWRPTPTASVYT